MCNSLPSGTKECGATTVAKACRRANNIVLFQRHSQPRTRAANCMRRPHQLNANQQHHVQHDVQMIEIKYCEDTRPGQQLEAAQWQHADFLKNVSGKAVTLLDTLLGVGGT
eukprot:1143405-Pelagomonas_calceolata.AAC.1